MNENKYKMSISLNVLNHLGLNLYSNTPAVIAEVIANAWDADATEVYVDFNKQENSITIRDNGHGMNLDDINGKYLYVGYQKRKANISNRTIKGNRILMGRKGIGKLSLFAISKKFYVYSKKAGYNRESFLMDADKVADAIQSENPSQLKEYQPEPIDFNVQIEDQGTVIKITDLKQLKITENSINGLKKRIARRFGLIEDDIGFSIFVDQSRISFSDRGYFHKARFLFQYGNLDYSQHCNNLDSDSKTGESLSFNQDNCFDVNGQPAIDGDYKISGWIAIARHSYDLDDEGHDDNLNKITIVVRNKVAQEDILQEYRLGGMITKYMFGEIHADFLDEDDKEDITTSSRQRITEDDVRYQAVKKFVKSELKDIWNKTNSLMEKKSLEVALSTNPYIKQWYDNLRPKNIQIFAKNIFTSIDRAGVDERHKQEFYVNGILAFEALKLRNALKTLKNVNESNLSEFLSCLSDIDAIEAAHYREIVVERLRVIEEFNKIIDENAKEKVLQKYIFKHLWLLDPSWERATIYKHMEQRLQKVIKGVTAKKKANIRVDIRYRRVAGSHVIIELKRAKRKLDKIDIESQLVEYIEAVKLELSKTPDESKFPIESFCIVGQLPKGWENSETRKQHEESLKPYSIRVITYSELIDRAYSSYSKFIEAGEGASKLRDLIENIRSYKPSDSSI